MSTLFKLTVKALERCNLTSHCHGYIIPQRIYRSLWIKLHTAPQHKNHTVHRTPFHQIFKYQVLNKNFQFVFDNSLSDYFFQVFFPENRHFAQKLFTVHTVQKMKFPIKDFFSKCDQILQIHSFLRISSHLLEKSLTENFKLHS